MPHYVVGDLQGCLDSLRELLRRIAFEPSRDRLTFVGDLVNRGPQSLATLRFVRALGPAAETVLGNHDLYLLAVAVGVVPAKATDTFHDVLEAPDRDELLAWLATRPLALSVDEALIVHAGVLPQWTAEKAQSLADEVHAALRVAPSAFLHDMFGNLPDRWSDDLTGPARLRVIVNALTRLRVCTPDGRMEFATKGDPAGAPKGYVPWFEVEARQSRNELVIFGHWSALGIVRRPNVIGLDSGCVWGRQLSALRLTDRVLFQVDCPCRSSLTD
jgi:bis(5'-nucleosyl)-tetraphosphatase (symmetrical)